MKVVLGKEHRGKAGVQRDSFGEKGINFDEEFIEVG